MNAIRLYRHVRSGHAHRAQLMLSLLRLPYEPIDVDFAAGAQRSAEFLRKNPFGQVPVIEDGDITLADSNAILVYLATRYDKSGRWYPREADGAARIQQWLSVAAGQLAYGPAAARRVKLIGAKLDYAGAVATATELFSIMDRHLAHSNFLVGGTPTIADVALYSYTVLAPEGGIALSPYGSILAWLARIEALDGFIPMTRA